MPKKGLKSPGDVHDFFHAFNRHDWEKVFQYMSDDCIWKASEECLNGITEIRDYWTKHHKAIKETLGRPDNITFGNDIVFLEVQIRMDFIEDGYFYGKAYKKGEFIEFGCADVYELSGDSTIKECRVYIKFL